MSGMAGVLKVENMLILAQSDVKIKIIVQVAATDRSIQAIQTDLKKQVAALNQKIATVQAEAKTMVDVASKQSRQDTLKVRAELMAGLKALQKVVTDSHNQMTQQLAKLNAPK